MKQRRSATQLAKDLALFRKEHGRKHRSTDEFIAWRKARKRKSAAVAEAASMVLSFHESNLIEAIRNSKVHGQVSEPLIITITLGGPEIRVRWETQGFQGNGAGSSFDDAYQRAWDDYGNKFFAAHDYHSGVKPPATD